MQRLSTISGPTVISFLVTKNVKFTYYANIGTVIKQYIDNITFAPCRCYVQWRPPFNFCANIRPIVQ